MKTKTLLLTLATLVYLVGPQIAALAQGTAFTYQGNLNTAGLPANGWYDLRFALYDASTGGAQQGNAVTNVATLVSNGLFTATLDFGNQFPGSARWLDVGVRTNGAGAFVSLTPRQPLTPGPYAVTAQGVISGGITSTMLASGAVTGDKLSTGAVTATKIDDGGNGAYAGFQQAAQSVGGDTSLSFSNLFVVPTSGGNPSFALTINSASPGTVVGFSGYEGMSEPYYYVVEVSHAGGVASPEAQLGLNAQLTFSRNGRVTTFSGIVTAFTAAGTDGKSFLYLVRIESPLAYLALKTDYRIYQSMTASAVASSVYQGIAGTAPTSNLVGSYPTHASLTQYGESSFNFFSRTLEQEGIFYFFNMSTATPGLVLADGTSAYLTSPNSPFLYYGDTTTNTSAAEYIRTFQKASHQSTLTATVNSYNFTTPAASLAASANNGTQGTQEDYQFGNAVQTLAYDQLVARARADRQAVEHQLILGSATTPDLRAGYTFGLTDQSGVGVSGTYVVTAVHHAGFVRVTNGVSSWFYGNQFQAIPATLPFRPAMSTPKPHAEPCTAVVTGAAGEEIYTDQYGRLKVQFHWDRYGNKDQNSSAWIRLASPIASSSGRGMFFLPRMGDEVVVSFLQGDPDQPIITGSLYNGVDVTPYSLPANKAISAIRSTGTKGQPGQINEIRFNDLVGSQELRLQGARDLNLVAANNATLQVGTNFTGSISGTATLTAGGNLSLQSSATLSLQGAQTTISSPLSISGAMNLDQANQNTGTLNANALTFGAGSGEGLASKRTSGSNQYDLELYTDFIQRMVILNNGNVGIGNTAPGALLVVGGGAYCNGTTWVNSSDRDAKTDFSAIDPCAVLEKVCALPITEWHYKAEGDGQKHLGPVAQDFHAAFGLNGGDDRHISTVDESGVALAAIQGLNRRLAEKDREITDLKERLEKLERLLESKDAGSK